MRIGVKLSQQQIGELVGKTRGAVNKQLRIWADDGIMSTIDGHLVVHDAEALEGIAGIAVV